MPSSGSIRSVVSAVALLLAATLAASAQAPPPPPPRPTTDAAELAAARAGGTRLQGSAELGRRQPVVGATVKAVDESHGRLVMLTSTAADGRFRIEGVPDGTYVVTLDKPGLEPLVKRDVEVKFPTRPTLEVRMQPGPGMAPAAPAASAAAADESATTLSGVVTTGESTAVPDVTLRFVREDGSRDPRAVRTGTEGNFEIPDLAPGLWRLEVRGVGYLPVRTVIDVRPGQELRVSLVPQPADYSPGPLDLLPPEEPIPPPEWGARLSARRPAPAEPPRA